MKLMNKNENKKLLMLTRIILFVVGFTIGFLVMWQVLNENSEIAKRLIIRIIFYVAAGLVPATVLFLSAKPVYFLFAAIGNKLRARSKTIKANDIASVMLGVLIGGTAAVGTHLLLSLFVKIIALKTFIVIVVAVVAAYISVVLCSQWLKGSENPAEDEVPSDELSLNALNKSTKGYLINTTAFSEPRLIKLCTKWLIGEKYVLAGAEQLLDDEAKQNYLTLLNLELINIIDTSLDEGRIKAEETIAKEHELKIIVRSCQDELNYSKDSLTLALDEI